MPANKRAQVTTPLPQNTQSGTHPIVPPPLPPAARPDAKPRHPLSGLMMRQDGTTYSGTRMSDGAPAARAPAARRRERIATSPEIEIGETEDPECGPGVNVNAIVEAPCDGCGVVVEVELSRFLESSAVACSGCLDAVVKGWGKSCDRPTLEWMPSYALLCASKPPPKR
jgi:hypothetical protein